MESNEVDLIYILDRPRYNNNWNKMLEEAEPLVFVVGPGHPLAKQEEIAVDELIKESFFLTEKDENYRQDIDCFMESRGIELEPVIESASVGLIIEAVSENKGIAFLPYFLVEKEVRRGDLAILHVPEFQTKQYCQIFYHKNKHCSEEMKVFIQEVKGIGKIREE